MSDLIDGQAAIDALDVGAEVLRRVLDETDVVGVERAKYEWGLRLIESYISDIEELPSAQPDLQPTCNQLATDTISRQAAIDSVCKYCEYYYNENIIQTIKDLPSAQPTLHGYNIEHLELIAIVLQKEDLPPERVVEALTYIGRIVAIVRDEFEETLRRAVQNIERRTDDLQ